MPGPQVQVVSMRIVGRQLSSKASRAPAPDKVWEVDAFESTAVLSPGMYCKLPQTLRRHLLLLDLKLQETELLAVHWNQGICRQ